MNGLQKLQKLWAAGGLPAVSRAIRKRFIYSRWCSLVLVHRDQVDAAALMWPNGYRYEFYNDLSDLTTAEVDALRRQGAGLFLESLSETDGVYIVWESADIASYGAVMRSSPQSSVLGLPSSACLIGLCETRLAHRKRGLFSLALMQTVLSLRSREYNEIFIEVDEANLPSRKGIAKAGFEHLTNIDAQIWFGALVRRSNGWHRLARGGSG